MFCTKCGTEVPEGNAFCAKCGNKIGVDPVRQPVAQPAQPEKAKFGVAEKLKAVKLPKMNFPKSADGEKKSFENPFAGNKPLLVKALAICCVLLLLLSYCVVINTSFEKIPLISTMFSIAGEGGEIDDLFEEFDDYADRLDSFYEMAEDELEDELSKGEMKKLKKFVDISNKCAKKMSLNNFTKLLNSYKDLDKIGMEDIADYIVDSVEEAKEMKLLLNVIKGFLFVCALVCAVVVFFGGYKFKFVLAIVGVVLSAMFCLSYCHFLLTIVNLAAQIYMVYMIKQDKCQQEPVAA